MFESIPLENPYEKIYRATAYHKHISIITESEVLELVQHLGFMYNTFGLAIKDLVKIVSVQFKKQEKGQAQTTLQTCKEQLQGDCYIRKAQNDKKTVQNKQKKKGNLLLSQKSVLTASTIECVSPQILEGNITVPFNQKHEMSQLQLQSQIDSKSQTSTFSLQTRQQKQNMKISENLNNFPQFQSQFFKPESPAKKIEAQQIYELPNILELSHKQKFIDPSYCIIEQQNEEIDLNNEIINLTKGPTDIEVNKIDNKIKQQSKPSEFVNEVNSNVRVAVGRKKKDRQNLTGISCLQCEKYYKVMQVKGDNICECTSRHRSNLPGKRHKQDFTQQFDL